MMDWQGNEIQVGDTIQKIAIKSLFAGSKMYCAFFVDGELQKNEGIVIEDKPLWNIMETAEVMPYGNVITSTAHGEIHSQMPINFIESFFSPQFYEIICIKGKSDNELDYLKHINQIS